VDAWALAWVFKHHALRAFRLTQVERSRFQLELAGATEADVGPLCERLTAALRNLGWMELQLEVSHVEPPALATGAKPQPFRTSGPAG
jgi:phenylacetate-CoA ligase